MSDEITEKLEAVMDDNYRKFKEAVKTDVHSADSACENFVHAAMDFVNYQRILRKCNAGKNTYYNNNYKNF